MSSTSSPASALPPSSLIPNWKTIIFMAIIHLGALLVFLPGTFSWSAVGLAVTFYWITGGLGITLGWHRLLSHRSFQTPKWLEYVLVFCGTLACEGSVFEWVGLHRNHHIHSDTDADQHNSRQGFWWSHMGWMLYDIPAKSEIERLTKDIKDDKFYQLLNKNFIPIQIVLALLFYAWGGLPFLVWGIFVRLVVVYHITWFVNSATHQFGYRNFDCADASTNCWWVALLSYGEGWHNNHHAYPHSARHGLKWWEVDFTWMTIRVLQALGLATKVRLVDTSTATSIDG